MSNRSFRIDPAVFDAFSGMVIVVAVTDGLDNSVDRKAVSAQWQEAWKSVADHGIDDARKHPFVDAWRRDFARLGVSMKRYPTSVEAMLKRALKGGECFTINPLVDFYNAITLRYACAAGAFDLGVLSQRIELRLTSAGDRFQSLDADEAIDLPGGEIAYASGRDVLTRHFMWRQSKLALVTPNTEQVFLVSEVPGVAGLEVAQQIEAAFLNGLAEHFGCSASTFLLSESLTSVSW